LFRQGHQTAEAEITARRWGLNLQINDGGNGRAGIG
jgi:hypothetical protein